MSSEHRKRGPNGGGGLRASEQSDGRTAERAARDNWLKRSSDGYKGHMSSSSHWNTWKMVVMWQGCAVGGTVGGRSTAV